MILKFINSDQNRWVMYLVLILVFCFQFYVGNQTVQIYKSQVERLKNQVEILKKTNYENRNK